MREQVGGIDEPGELVAQREAARGTVGHTRRYGTMATRAYGNRQASPVEDTLERALREGLRRMRRSADGLTYKQTRLLEDFARDGRYVAGFQQIVEIARCQCRRPEDAVAIADELRRFILQGHVIDLPPVPEAFRKENAANDEGDRAQWGFRDGPTRTTRDWVYETMRGQAVWSEIAADAVIHERPALISVP